MRTALVIAVGVLTTACGASWESAGHKYRDRGNHELASVYFAAHQRSSPDDDEARILVLRSIEDALATIDADFEARMRDGDFRAALGLATRKSELLSFARSLKLDELAARSAKPEMDQAYPKAARQALDAVDEAEGAGKPPEEITGLLRRALALDPNNAELASRYMRTRSGLMKVVTVRTACDASIQNDCDVLAASLLARMTIERRELLQLAAEASKTKNAELRLELRLETDDTDWVKTDTGQAGAQVPRLDKFKQPVLNAKGKKVMDPVVATFETWQRVARAKITTRVELRDLGPSAEVLYQRDLVHEEKDTRRYITWKGDERALGARLKAGTNHSPPADLPTLTRRALDAAASQIANEVLGKVEGLTS